MDAPSATQQVDKTQALSDYILDKAMGSIENEELQAKARNLTPDAQLFVASDLQELRAKFGDFVKQINNAEGEKVITAEAVKNFFQERSDQRRLALKRALSQQAANSNFV